MASLGVSLAETGGSLVMGLLAAHDKRVQAAKEENAALAQAVTALDADLKTVFTAANNGDITPQVAAQACQDVHNWFWAFVQPLQQGATKGPTQTFPNPGAPNNAAVGGIYYEASDGANCHCGTNAACTASCCVGCAAIDPCLSNAYKWFLAGKAFTLTRPVIVANKYGLPQSGPYNLTFTPPKKENAEAEVTIAVKTGIITVGAAPSQGDAVIASGVTTIGAAPDTGGDVIQHTATGADNPATTTAATAGGTLTGLIASIPGGYYTLIGVGILLLFLLMRPSQPQVIEVGAPVAA